MHWSLRSLPWLTRVVANAARKSDWYRPAQPSRRGGGGWPPGKKVNAYKVGFFVLLAWTAFDAARDNAREDRLLVREARVASQTARPAPTLSAPMYQQQQTQHEFMRTPFGTSKFFTGYTPWEAQQMMMGKGRFLLKNRSEQPVQVRLYMDTNEGWRRVRDFHVKHRDQFYVEDLGEGPCVVRIRNQVTGTVYEAPIQIISAKGARATVEIPSIMDGLGGLKHVSWSTF